MTCYNNRVAEKGKAWVMTARARLPEGVVFHDGLLLTLMGELGAVAHNDDNRGFIDFTFGVSAEDAAEAVRAGCEDLSARIGSLGVAAEVSCINVTSPSVPTQDLMREVETLLGVSYPGAVVIPFPEQAE